MAHTFDENKGLFLPNQFKELMGESDDFNKITSFLEGLAKLELQLEDEGWQSLGNDDEIDLSQKSRKNLQKEAYAYWVKNPLLGRAVETNTNYIYGNGFNYQADSDNVQETLDAFMDDEDNKREMTTLQSQQVKCNELQIYGELFLVFFVDEMTGRVKIRSLPPTQVSDVITHPEDAQQPLWYKRDRNVKKYDFNKQKYKVERETKYYADWKQPDDLGGVEPPESQKAEGVIYHIKVNCLSHNKRGFSKLYRGMDWAGAYNKFLEDLASVWDTLSKFVAKNKVKGTSGDLQKQAKNLKEMLSSMNKNAGGIYQENTGSNLETMNVRGASLDAEDGRRLLLMVCSATGLVEPFFGDPSTANLATMEAMMGPMLKMFSSDQELWKSIWQNIFDFVIDKSIEADGGILKGHIEEDMYGTEFWVIADEIERTFEIDFPQMVDKDIPEMVEAVKDTSETYLVPEKELSRILLNLFDVDNVDKVLGEMYDGDGNQEPQINHDGEIEEGMSQEALIEAVQKIVKKNKR